MSKFSGGRTALLTGTAMIAALAPATAFAQTQAGVDATTTMVAPSQTSGQTRTGKSSAQTPTEQTTQQTLVTDDASSNQLGDIVVTAQRRETNLQSTPISISVLNTQALTDRHVLSLRDLGDGSVPSLRVTTFEARNSALTVGIRGIVPLDANQPAREQGVGIYIDGVYLGRQHGLDASLFDVDRIEVLKGPQGTLFGRNTEGGALSIVTKAPSGVFGFRVTGGVGNYDSHNVEGHLDLPEVANISLKFDGILQYQAPTTRDPLPGSIGWNYYDRKGLRAAARWKPTSTITADFAYDYGYDANTPFYSQLLNANPNGCIGGGTATAPTPQSVQPNCSLPGTNFTGYAGTIKPIPAIVQIEGKAIMPVADIGVPQQPSVDKSNGWTGHLSWKPADFVELRSITAWRTVSATQWDNSGGAHRVPVIVPGGNFSRYSLADLTQRQFSQEFQAVGSVAHFDYVAGLYYFNEQAQDDAATPSSARYNADGTVTILNPDIFPGSSRNVRSIDRASIANSKSYAAYGQATYTPQLLDEALHLTVGGRYTHDDKRGSLFTVNNAPTSFAFRQKTNRFNPTATLAVDATPNIHLYAKYATGYRAGGASSRSVSYRQFGPEDLKSYEIGGKTEFFDRRLRLNVAGYISDRKGSQVDFNSVNPVLNAVGVVTGTRNTLETINAPGTTRISGVEVDATLRVTRELTLSGGYAYTYTKIPNTLNPFTGVVQPVFIVFTPRNAASGAADFDLPFRGMAARLHLDANYAQSTQSFDQYETKADSSFLVNGRLSLADIDLGYGNSKLTIAVWARNMFDRQYVYRRDPTNSYPSTAPIGVATPNVGNVNNILGDYGNFAAPRTFGIEGTVKY